MDHWKNRSCDQGPVLIDIDRNNRLDIEEIGRVLVRADIKHGVILQRQADGIGHRVLGQGCEIFGFACLAGICRQAGKRQNQCHYCQKQFHPSFSFRVKLINLYTS